MNVVVYGVMVLAVRSYERAIAIKITIHTELYYIYVFLSFISFYIPIYSIDIMCAVHVFVSSSFCWLDWYSAII